MSPFRSSALVVGSSPDCCLGAITRRKVIAVPPSVLSAILLADSSQAQMSGFAAKPLLESSVERDESKEAVMLAITIAPGGSSGRHTHPGDCYGTVVEGTVELRVEGRQPRRASAGEAWHNPRGVIHELRNVGDAPVRVVNILGGGQRQAEVAARGAGIGAARSGVYHSAALAAGCGLNGRIVAARW